jgi:hypothetical protein
MRRRELNCATNKLANNRKISGGATADEINCCLQIGKGSKLWRIACSTFLRSLMVSSLCIVLAPAPGRAENDNDKDAHPGREDNDKGIRAEIAALQAQVTSLRSTVSGLQGQVQILQNSNKSLQSQLTVVQSNPALKLGPFVTVVSGPGMIDGVKGPHIYFTGANIHIVSGSGFTDDSGNPRGLGNLIIGYDEDPQKYSDRSPLGDLPLGPLGPGDRGGSHNLVIGAANRFTQAAFGGLVVGTANTIESYGASVSGGAGNTASNYGASVSAGFSGTASGPFASVSGGRFNGAGQFFTSVSGGESNLAGGGGGGRFNGLGASVSGGSGNTASGNWASVSGGGGNTAFDYLTSVTGGTGNTAGSSVTFQGGFAASVVGGSGNTAGGHNTVVIGGQNIIDYIDFTIQPKAPFP